MHKISKFGNMCFLQIQSDVSLIVELYDNEKYKEFQIAMESACIEKFGPDVFENDAQTKNNAKLYQFMSKYKANNCPNYVRVYLEKIIYD